MRQWLPLSLVACLAARPAIGADFSTVDLKPLLNIRVDSSFSSPRFPTLVSDASIFITRGGATTNYTAHTFPFAGFVHRNELVRAVAVPAEIVALRQELAANQVGQQQDCQGSVAGLHGPVAWDVRWYGHGEIPRRHSFQVYFGIGPEDLAPCTEEVSNIIKAVKTYLGLVRDNPGTEILRSN